MKRSNLTIALYLFLIFASGILVGAFGYRLYTGTPVSAKTSATVSPDEWRRQYVSEMRSRLKLAPEQMERLNAILDDTRSRSHQAHDTLDSALKQIKQHHVDAVNAMLNPEQRPEYEKLRAERDRRGKASEKK
jgi:hypothetical protein